MSTSATQSQGSVPANIPIQIDATAQVNHSFESNLVRLFTRLEGETRLKAATIALLSVAFVLPVVSIAIFDVIRAIGFQIGKTNKTVAEYFDGKSFSLIDKTSNACKAIAKKTSDIFESCIAPKTITLQDVNNQSQRITESLVNKLVTGYRQLFENGYFTSNDSFSTSKALSGEKQLAGAKHQLVAEINTFVANNTKNTEHFAQLLDSTVNTVREMIRKEAKDDFYIENKMVRTGPRPLLADKIIAEFETFFKEGAGQSAIAAQFAALATQESDVIQSLKKGVEQKILTPDQAKHVVATQACSAYAQGLNTGTAEAGKAAEIVLNTAVKNDLLTQEESKLIENQIQPPLTQLAAAAAKEVIQNSTPEMTDELIKQQLVRKAEDLIDAKKLSANNKSEFLTQSHGHLDTAKKIIEAEAKAQQKAQLKANQEAAADQAKKTAAELKAAQQASEFGTFTDLLGMISQKQTALSTLFTERNALSVQQQQATGQILKLKETQVTVITDKKPVTTSLESASKIYSDELVKISNKKMTDAQRAAALHKLVNNDDNTKRLIDDLGRHAGTLKNTIEEMKAISDKIQTQYDELLHLVGVYFVYTGHNQAQLQEKDSKKISEFATQIIARQDKLQSSYKKALSQTGILDHFKQPKPSLPVNKDKKANKDEVEKLLAAHKAQLLAETTAKAAPSVTETQVEQPVEAVAIPPSKSTVTKLKGAVGTGLYGLWRLGTYPVRAPFNAIFGQKSTSNN